MAVTFNQLSESIQQKHIPTVDYPSSRVLCQEPQTAEATSTRRAEATDLPDLVTISSPHSVQEEVALDGGQVGPLIPSQFSFDP